MNLYVEWVADLAYRGQLGGSWREPAFEITLAMKPEDVRPLFAHELVSRETLDDTGRFMSPATDVLGTMLGSVHELLTAKQRKRLAAIKANPAPNRAKPRTRGLYVRVRKRY